MIRKSIMIITLIVLLFNSICLSGNLLPDKLYFVLYKMEESSVNGYIYSSLKDISFSKIPTILGKKWVYEGTAVKNGNIPKDSFGVFKITKFYTMDINGLVAFEGYFFTIHETNMIDGSVFNENLYSIKPMDLTSK